MTYTTKNGVTIPLDMPEGEKKETRYSHPSYVKACLGNESMAAILDYFVYAASSEIKNKKLEGCNVVTVTRTHEDILAAISGKKPSMKSLIRYIKQFNAWKMVCSEPYQREYTIDLNVIQNAIATPPTSKLPIKRARKEQQQDSQRLQEKGGHVTTLQPFEKVDMLQRLEVEALREKVDMLQQKVDMLQLESGHVTTFCGHVTTLQRAFVSLVTLVQDRFSGSPLITSNILPLITSIESVAASADNTPLSPSMSSQSLGSDIIDFAYQVCIEEWYPYVKEHDPLLQSLEQDIHTVTQPSTISVDKQGVDNGHVTHHLDSDRGNPLPGSVPSPDMVLPSGDHRETAQINPSQPLATQATDGLAESGLDKTPTPSKNASQRVVEASVNAPSNNGVSTPDNVADTPSFTTVGNARNRGGVTKTLRDGTNQPVETTQGTSQSGFARGNESTDLGTMQPPSQQARDDIRIVDGATNDAPSEQEKPNGKVTQEALLPDVQLPNGTMGVNRGKQSGKSNKGKKAPVDTDPVLPKPIPQMPPADMVWGTHKCKLMFDY